jgi:hypothetical protein
MADYVAAHPKQQEPRTGGIRSKELPEWVKQRMGLR